jgi:hypothetical protein
VSRRSLSDGQDAVRVGSTPIAISKKEATMLGAVKRRLLGTILAMLAVGLVVAPVSFAGEDTTDGTTSGGDGGSASGGVSTGAGGMSIGGEPVTVELLAGTGILLLSAGALASRRRSNV